MGHRSVITRNFNAFIAIFSVVASNLSAVEIVSIFFSTMFIQVTFCPFFPLSGMAQFGNDAECQSYNGIIHRFVSLASIAQIVSPNKFFLQ